MKGIVFTEFLDLVEERFGYEMVDTIIEKSDLPSKGSYTAVGTYDHAEMLSLLGNLSHETNIPANDLLRLYGNQLFDTLMGGYKKHLVNINSAFELLSAIESYIHVEVRKLYPDAELPYFETKMLSPNQLRMVYSSERKMWAFGLGLMEGCFKHFNETAQITHTLLTEDGSSVEFIITRNL
jgi:hypothetical protein